MAPSLLARGLSEHQSRRGGHGPSKGTLRRHPVSAGPRAPRRRWRLLWLCVSAIKTVSCATSDRSFHLTLPVKIPNCISRSKKYLKLSGHQQRQLPQV